MSTKKDSNQTDPSQPDYWTEARDFIFNLVPFYDPYQKCAIVRDKVFFDVVKELKARTAFVEQQLAEARKQRNMLAEALQSIANEDYRGNRPWSALFAERTLHEVKGGKL